MTTKHGATHSPLHVVPPVRHASTHCPFGQCRTPPRPCTLRGAISLYRFALRRPAVHAGSATAGFRRNRAFVDCRTVPDVRYRRQHDVGVRRTWRAATVIVVRCRTRVPHRSTTSQAAVGAATPQGRTLQPTVESPWRSACGRLATPAPRPSLPRGKAATATIANAWPVPANAIDLPCSAAATSPRAVMAMTGCGGGRRWIEPNHSNAPQS